jgi:hypothetical protein
MSGGNIFDIIIITLINNDKAISGHSVAAEQK